MSKPKQYPSQKELLELFSYDSDTGKLFWKAGRGNKIKAGTEVSSKTKDGYLRVTMHYKTYQVHRIVWIILHGEIPEGKLVDHLDGNRENNRPDNLRLVDDSENSRNRAKRSNNTSGVTGVYFDKKRGNWRVQVYNENHKKIMLGSYKNLEEAKRVRDEYLVWLEETFGIAYTKRHGE